MEHTPEEEERINAVMRYLEGERQVDIYRSLGRSKFWLNKWRNRYKTGRKDWYKDPFIDQDYFNFRNRCPILKGL